MDYLSLDQIRRFLTGIEPLVGLLWLGLAAFTVGLLVLMITRWGQSRPLGKCVVLSLIAHLLMAGYATTVQIVGATTSVEDTEIAVSLLETTVGEGLPVEENTKRQRYEEFAHDVSPEEVLDVLELETPKREDVHEFPTSERDAVDASAALPDRRELNDVATDEVDALLPEPVLQRPRLLDRASSAKTAPEDIEVPVPEHQETPQPWLGPLLDAPQRSDDSTESTVERSVPSTESPGEGLPDSLLDSHLPLPRLDLDPTRRESPEAIAALPDRMTVPGAGRMESLPGESSSPDVETPDSSDSGSLPAPADPSLLPEVTPTRSPSNAGHDEAINPLRQAAVPDAYRLRVAPDRIERARLQGATVESEKAVRAALQWLATNQHPDGRWDASAHGAGRELYVAGRDRQAAGMRADTGITGLALLAYLASGHTHRNGSYSENVRRGLEYLIAVQGSDGHLGGEAAAYARMYCHSMAAFALSEAYGLSGDRRLRPPVQRAVDYTLAAQDKSGGGWRYNPGDVGDTSQCGWQFMVLKSAELAGIPTPAAAKDGLVRYLRTVSAGTHGGLASYRPNEKISHAMTAEAMVCWQFLGMPRENPAADEAGDYLLTQLPGSKLPGNTKPNFYYWYYGTLAMYQLQGEYWDRWNDALQKTLLQTQVKSGPMSGSWTPETVWGGYGGRVYSTAMATLCLEVYYRFLPLYVEANPSED